MNADAKMHAAKLLKRCHSLTDAELALVKIKPEPSRSMVWGLLDGYLDRPETTTSFSKDPAQSFCDSREYREGFGVGQELRAER